MRHDNWIPNGCPINYYEDVMEELGIHYVSDLIATSGSEWSKELVEFVFCPATAAHILSIPLPSHGRGDALYWPDSVDGNYNSLEMLELVHLWTRSLMLLHLLHARLWMRFVEKSFGGARHSQDART